MLMRGRKMLGGVLGPKGPLSVFHDYPLLLRFAAISVCAEIAWATLIIVLQYHFQEDLFVHGETKQFIASKIATVTLAFVGCEMLFKVPMGSLSDRYGPKPLIFFALGLATVSPLLMILATQWYQFIPMRMMDGLAAAALWPAMSSLMARSVPREAKAAAMSVFNGAYCLGLAIGPITGLLVAHQFGNRSVFPLCALLLLLGLFLAYTFLHGDIGLRAQPTNSEEHGVNTRVLKGRPLLVRMMVIYALSQAAVGMFINVAVPYIKDQFGITEGDLPRAIVVPALFVAFLALPLGRMADKIGRPKAIWISYVLAAFGMTFIAATSLFEPDMRAVSPSISLFAVGMLLMIASYILGTPAWLGLTSLQVDETKQGKALSLMQTAQGLGIVLASILVASAGHFLSTWKVTRGRITEDAIPINMWLWLAAGIFFLCFIGTLLYVREPDHTESAEEEADAAKQSLEISGV